MKPHIFLIIISCLIIIQTTLCNDEEYEKYCLEKGGIISTKIAGFDTHIGYVAGLTMKFCQIDLNGNLAMIGLETFASTKPSLVSTYAKALVIDPEGRIKGPFSQPATNLCFSLGGSTINFFVNGGFRDELGYAGICFFGDGSHISGWTLLYAAYGSRPDIKNGIQGEVLNINIPSIY